MKSIAIGIMLMFVFSCTNKFECDHEYFEIDLTPEITNDDIIFACIDSIGIDTTRETLALTYGFKIQRGEVVKQGISHQNREYPMTSKEYAISISEHFFGNKIVTQHGEILIE